METDVLVVGGGVGGCAAAWAALRLGRRVVMTEPTDWIGGQLTSQAVPPDEHPWIEMFGCTASYRRLRDEIRSHYKRFYPLTATARAVSHLNPGNGFVSAICHEPRVSHAVLESFLRPYQAGRRLEILLEHVPERAEVEGDRVSAVTLRALGDDARVTIRAPYVIDATELGDLLPLAGVEYVSGAESRAETGEPHAADEARPDNMQAISWCFVIAYDPRGDHTIERPRDYLSWRDYDPALRPPWGSRLLSWSATHPITLEPVVRSFNPEHPQPERGPMDLWTFRRIADRSNFEPGAYESDIVLVNWPQIDYIPGNVIDVSAEEQARHLEGARQLSLSMLYWMQTEAPREDGGTGWRGLRLRPDITGTPDGLAKAPYIREARRIRGAFTVKEQHVGLEARMAETGASPDEVRAASFADSVGIGAYRIDLHPSTAHDNYIDVGALPFQIPLGALIPQRVENLLAGGKNLSVTHLTNGCYRLHPVEWNVGEAAGLLAAWSLERGMSPRAVRERGLADFQGLLRAQGVELEWPRVSPL
jgi:hypothetical protein